MMANLREEIAKINQEQFSAAEEELKEEEQEATSEKEVEQEASEEASEETIEEPVVEEKEEEIQFFNELPEALGMDPDQFYNLKLKGTNGKEYTWSEVKDKLQSIETTEAELAQQKAAIEQQQEAALQFQQQQQPLTQEVQQAANFLGQLEQAYQVKYRALEAAKESRDTDAMAELNTDLLEIQNQWGAAKQQYDTAMQQQQIMQQQAYEQHRLVQHKKLAQLAPDFVDPEKGKQTKAALKEYLLEQTITPQEIGNLVDARVVNLFYKAMQWDNHQKNVKKTTEQMRDKTVTRLVKGKHKTISDVSSQRQKAISRGRASNREADKRAAYLAVAQDAGLLNVDKG
jgi:hypothetical protein